MPNFVNMAQAVEHAAKMAKITNTIQFVSVSFNTPITSNRRPTDLRIKAIQVLPNGELSYAG